MALVPFAQRPLLRHALRRDAEAVEEGLRGLLDALPRLSDATDGVLGRRPKPPRSRSRRAETRLTAPRWRRQLLWLP
jgi:hypothetical protein